MKISSLADWVEFMALAGAYAPWNTVVDSMRESGIREEYQSLMTGGMSEEQDELEHIDESVKNCLLARSVYLTDLYPFEFDEWDRLVTKQDFQLDSNPYFILLCISLLQAWKANNDSNILNTVTKLFEFLIDAALKNMGIASSIIGTATSATDFESKLIRAGHELGITTNPTVSTHSRFAQDEGVDVVGGYLWEDGRKGQQLFLIQASCGQESVWKNKMTNINSMQWKNFFLEKTLPVPVIAVPYQMTQDALDHTFLEGGSYTFLDRMRLAHAYSSNGVLSHLSTNGKDFLSKLLEFVSHDLDINYAEGISL